MKTNKQREKSLKNMIEIFKKHDWNLISPHWKKKKKTLHPTAVIFAFH